MELRPDLDQVEALNPEREALWARLNAATFLTEDEKRLAAGYPAFPDTPSGRLPAGESLGAKNSEVSAKRNRPFDVAAKYSPDQPRVPAGGPGGGQWTDGGGGSEASSVDSGDNSVPSGSEFGPDKPGWHDYSEGPNVVCRAELRCTREEMVDYVSRFGVPGLNAKVQNRGLYVVYDPRYGFKAGTVRTHISRDGLTIVNRTMPDHILFDGQITRAAQQDAGGSWTVTTHGIGNNVGRGMNRINDWQGPKIFNFLDRQLRDYIERDKAGQKGLSRCFGGLSTVGVVDVVVGCWGEFDGE